MRQATNDTDTKYFWNKLPALESTLGMNGWSSTMSIQKPQVPRNEYSPCTYSVTPQINNGILTDLGSQLRAEYQNYRQIKKVKYEKQLIEQRINRKLNRIQLSNLPQPRTVPTEQAEQRLGTVSSSGSYLPQGRPFAQTLTKFPKQLAKHSLLLKNSIRTRLSRDGAARRVKSMVQNDPRSQQRSRGDATGEPRETTGSVHSAYNEETSGMMHALFSRQGRSGGRDLNKTKSSYEELGFSNLTFTSNQAHQK